MSSPQAKASQHALAFCLELISEGHQLTRLFFYNDGVLNCVAADDLDGSVRAAAKHQNAGPTPRG